MSQIQLLKDVKSQCGNIFAKGSTIEVLTKASKKDPSVEIYPVMAWDEEKLEYPVNNRLYTLSLKSTDYKEVAGVAMNKMAFGLPGNQTSEEDVEDILALSGMFEDKSVKWNMDGEVTKKAELEKEDEKCDEKCEDEKEEKTAKLKKTSSPPIDGLNFDENEIDGDGTASISRNIVADINNLKKMYDNAINNGNADFYGFGDGYHSMTSSIGKKLKQMFGTEVESSSGMHRKHYSPEELKEMIQTLRDEYYKLNPDKKTAKKVTAKEENNLTETDENLTTDLDVSVGGSGTVENCYSADESEKLVSPPLMGKINHLKNLLKKSVSEDNNVTDSKDTITTDFDSGIDGSGTVEDCYSEDTSANEAKPPILGEL